MNMLIDSLREALKSGPVSSVYAHLRQAKRQFRNEPIAGPLHNEMAALSIRELRELAAHLPSHARIYFSLALQYIYETGNIDLLKALACLRCAEALGFESPERIRLYKALICAEQGDFESADRYASALTAYELTVEENALRDQVLQKRTPPTPSISESVPSAWRLAMQEAERDLPQDSRILVVGDVGAASAAHFPQAGYLLAEPAVTGVPLSAIADFGIKVDVVVCSASLQQDVRTLSPGARCYIVEV